MRPFRGHVSGSWPSSAATATGGFSWLMLYSHLIVQGCHSSLSVRRSVDSAFIQNENPPCARKSRRDCENGDGRVTKKGLPLLTPELYADANLVRVPIEGIDFFCPDLSHCDG